MSGYRRMRATCSAVVVLLLLSAGCQLGPGAMKVGHAKYNDAIRQTSTEQLLRNIVRLRYTDVPVFLQITSISSQFVFEQSGSVSGTLTENVGLIDGKAPDLLNVSGNVGYQERPTITYAIAGNEFFKSLLTPIRVIHLAMLAESGWGGERVMRLAVEKINALDNAPSASGPARAETPRYVEFLEAIQLMRSLRRSQLIGFEYEERAKTVSDPLPPTAIQTMGMSELLKLGVEFKKVADDQYVLQRKERVLVMRFSQRANESADASRLRELLRLESSRARFDLVEYDDSETDDLDPSALWDDLALDTRSLLGIMFYMSKGIRVPEEHFEAGLAMEARDGEGRRFDWSEIIGDLFVVHTSKTKPINAMVRVRYHGHWFFIRGDDHASKSTFTLLLALFRLTSIPVEATKPVLTLPVGGG